MKEILISGATGYLGQKVCRQLIALGATPIIIARPVTETIARSAFPHLRVLIWGQERLPPSDALLILGTYFTGQTELGDAERLCKANVEWPTLLTEAYLSAGGQHVVGIGSCWEQIGNQLIPANSYAASKAACRLMLQTITAERQASLCWLRLTDTFGIDDPRKKIYSVLRSSIIAGGPPLALTFGEQIFDPLAAEDAATAIAISCVRSACETRGTWGISGGEPGTLREKIESYFDIVRKPCNVHWGARDYRRGEPFDIRWTSPPEWWAPLQKYEEAIRLMEQQPGGLIST